MTLTRYLSGSIAQMIERAREMTAHMPRTLPRTYDGLAQLCRNEINSRIAQLKWLKDDPLFVSPANQPERVRKFKRIVSHLDFLETTALAALKKAEKEDHRFNRLLDAACREINYPLPIPVITTLSQNYFHIYPELRLLRVPLIEGNFLLHLPDLYHELAHPLLTEANDPVVEPFQRAFASSTRTCLSYIRAEQAKNDRSHGPDKNQFLLRSWETSWAKFWLTEFYCDLFGLFIAGPAFAWSHLHLAVKRGGDPFQIAEFSPTSHPCDDARMRAMLIGLQAIQAADARREISTAWTEIIRSLNYSPEPEYIRCYPDQLLDQIVADALGATHALKCQIFSPTTSGAIVRTLNEAWTEFWSRPDSFPSWEKRQVASLFHSALAASSLA